MTVQLSPKAALAWERWCDANLAPATAHASKSEARSLQRRLLEGRDVPRWFGTIAGRLLRWKHADPEGAADFPPALEGACVALRFKGRDPKPTNSQRTKERTQRWPSVDLTRVERDVIGRAIEAVLPPDETRAALLELATRHVDEASLDRFVRRWHPVLCPNVAYIPGASCAYQKLRRALARVVDRRADFGFRPCNLHDLVH